MTGYDHLWIVGDNFVARSFRQFFLENRNFYTNQEYETSGHCNSRYTCNITNILVRMSTALISAINKHHRLPKYMVIIMDNDLTEFIKFRGNGIAKLIGLYLNSMIKDVEETIRDKKMQLPNKAVRVNYPLIYWVAAPTHMLFKDNEVRTRYNLCLESIIKSTEGMRVMKMKEYWFYDDVELVDNLGGMTTVGLSRYWQSIDASIKFNIAKNEAATYRKCRVQVTPQSQKKKEGKRTPRRRSRSPGSKDQVEEFFKKRRYNDRNHWDRNNVDSGGRREPQFLLPKPSGRK